jgi:hypothetical protein
VKKNLDKLVCSPFVVVTHSQNILARRDGFSLSLYHTQHISTLSDRHTRTHSLSLFPYPSNSKTLTHTLNTRTLTATNSFFLIHTLSHTHTHTHTHTHFCRTKMRIFYFRGVRPAPAVPVKSCC